MKLFSFLCFSVCFLFRGFAGGKCYYFEIVHEETVAGDHLQIAWKRPNQPRAIIVGQALAPARSTSPTR